MSTLRPMTDGMVGVEAERWIDDQGRIVVRHVIDLA